MTTYNSLCVIAIGHGESEFPEHARDVGVSVVEAGLQPGARLALHQPQVAAGLGALLGADVPVTPLGKKEKTW